MSICSDSADAVYRRGNRSCEYQRPNASSHLPRSFTPERGWRHSSLEQGGVQIVDFPTILFLAPALLQYGQLETANLGGSIPQHVLRLLGDPDEIRDTAGRFFNHIHKWMPSSRRKDSMIYTCGLRSTYGQIYFFSCWQ